MCSQQIYILASQYCSLFPGCQAPQLFKRLTDAEYMPTRTIPHTMEIHDNIKDALELTKRQNKN